jgi:hypothetical protein
MANLLPAPQPGLKLARATTFTAVYNVATTDPQLVNYADSTVSTLSSSCCVLHYITPTRHPQAYLCCAQRMNQVRVFCLHLPSRYTSALDGRLMPRDGHCYGFLGEVTQGLVTTVTFPGYAFRAVLNVRAKTSDYATLHLDELGDKGFPEPKDDDPDATVVSTLKVLYFQSKYVSLFFHPAGYTLQQTWELLYPTVVVILELLLLIMTSMHVHHCLSGS